MITLGDLRRSPLPDGTPVLIHTIDMMRKDADYETVESVKPVRVHATSSIYYTATEPVYRPDGQARPAVQALLLI